ncbi:NucA/NucB deoxyribonuclease domain-containing protein [Amycolatopsis sp. NPDC051758]|uniref:NucA/NucB deoxyribonuclease domain-containing protein n=1 Tax=Amycolatopsis sp. NPDC051758 TaxID=3363935 RepID=UPI0037B027C2
MRHHLARVLGAALLAALSTVTVITPADAATSTATTLDEQQDLRQQCEQQHATEAATAQGWLKSRFESCHRIHQDLLLTKKGTLQVVGTIKFDEWILGFSYDGSRRVDYIASIENMFFTADPGYDPKTWRLEQNFRYDLAPPQIGSITPAGATRRSELTGVWNSVPQWTVTYTSPDDGAPPPPSVVAGTIHVDTYVDAPDTEGWHDDVDRYSKVRFDTAGAIVGKARGAVFTDFKVVIPFSLNPAAGFPQAARHYDDALHHPVTTFPSVVGKNVPGGTVPLHRTTNTGTQDANTREAVKTCKDVWGPYDGQQLNCDEYPFATTREGAAVGDGQYSARLIDATDNQNAGRWLSSGYINNRIIDGDAFYIAITP